MIEDVLRALLENPDVAVKSFAIMALQFAVGVAFGYLVARAMKYVLALIGLTVLTSYITAYISPVQIDVEALVNAVKALLPIFILSTGPFFIGVVVGGVIGLLRR